MTTNTNEYVSSETPAEPPKDYASGNYGEDYGFGSLSGLFPRARRDHKSRLFVRLFQEPEELLNLYNAVNGSHYTDVGQLTVTTLEDVLYLGVKNDVSFLIGSQMNLYEHQSTWNPNMPLRGLFYFARLYAGYMAARKLNIYATVRLPLPMPRFVVFYNGTREMPERTQLKLSDSFQGMMAPGRESGEPGVIPEPALECRAEVININCGRNRELMESCRRLYEYSYLVGRIREYLSKGMTLEGAIDSAIDDCLKADMLTEFLTKHRGEAKMDLLGEDGFRLHLECLRDEAIAEGLAEGRTRGLEEGRTRGLEEGRMEGLAEGRAEGIVRHRILLVCRKLARGKSPREIAEDLEEELSEIEPICDIARAFAPDYDPEKIYQALKG